MPIKAYRDGWFLNDGVALRFVEHPRAAVLQDVLDLEEESLEHIVLDIHRISGVGLFQARLLAQDYRSWYGSRGT